MTDKLPADRAAALDQVKKWMWNINGHLRFLRKTENTIEISRAEKSLEIYQTIEAALMQGGVAQWQPIETYDYENFPEVWLAAWIVPSEYAQQNGSKPKWDIQIGRCWHVNTRKFTGVLGGSPLYWCHTNKPQPPREGE